MPSLCNNIVKSVIYIIIIILIIIIKSFNHPEDCKTLKTKKDGMHAHKKNKTI